MSLAEIKADARRAIHEEFGVPVTYTDLDGTVTPSAEQLAGGLVLTARFSTKARILAPDSDAVTIMENVERLIFNSEQLDALALELEQGGRLFLTDHLLAFEVTSIVLLVAAVGGVVLGSHARITAGEDA